MLQTGNINSVESTLFQYESRFTGNLPKYDDPFRSSDHDPALMALNILPTEPAPGDVVTLPAEPVNMPSADTLKEGDSYRAIVDLTDFSVTEMNIGERVNVVLSDKNVNNVVTKSQLGRVDLTREQIERGWINFSFQAVTEGTAVVEGFYNDEIITVAHATVEEEEEDRGGSLSVLFSALLILMAALFRSSSSEWLRGKNLMLMLIAPFLLAGCNENDQRDKVDVMLVITTDRFPEEISWSITDSKHDVVRAETGVQYEKNQEHRISLGLDPGGYRFEIKDSGNDGLCCSYGNGSFRLLMEGNLVLDDSNGFSDEIQYVFNTNAYSPDQYATSLSSYYADADLLDGYELKTALHTIIAANVNVRTEDDLLDFYSASLLDTTYENDQTLLDPYSENPSGADPYNYTANDDICGMSENEGDCFEREYAMPADWFDDDDPMDTDIHNIFAADAHVIEQRGDLPYGEVDGSTVTFTSQNGSRVGSGHQELGYSQPVFEPLDEFKGDLARAFFYMATRYEDVIAEDDWYGNSEETSAVFVEESEDQVYQSWFIEMLLYWNELDPVSPEERARNEAAFVFQGNRNPFIDYPEFAEYIWEHEGFEPAEYEFF